MKAFTWGVVLAWSFWSHTIGYKHIPAHQCDAKMYYYAAQGDFSWHRKQPTWSIASPSDTARIGWLYHPMTAVLWKPATLLSEKQYVVVNMALSTIAFWFVIYKLMKVRYGWFITLATLRTCGVFLVSGNVIFILLAIMLCFPGSFIAGAIKPPLGLVKSLGYFKSFVWKSERKSI